MAYCHKCGVETRIQTQFCGECGAPLEPQLGFARPDARSTTPVPLYPRRWRRIAAFLLDFLIVVVAVAVLDALLNGLLGGASALFLPVLDAGIAVTYFAGFESSPQQGTPGKQTLGLRVGDLQGNRVTLSRAIARNLAKYGLSTLAAFGTVLGKKRLPHDFVARTVVLLRNDARAAGAATCVDIGQDRPAARLAWTVLAAVAVFLALSFTTLRATTRNFEVVGAAMEPTLHNNEYLLVSTVAYQMHAPQRDDVVAFWAVPAGQPDRVFMQRIVGLPFETVQIASGAIYINDHLLRQPYGHTTPAYAFGPYTVPQGCYFVMGDNRNQSADSHLWHGLPRQDIIGKAWLLYWPSSDMRMF